jgi:3-isopropylmalate/(R)-2-methylmalate dehydratase small subunit
MNLILEGRCWKLGDDVSSDELISARHVYEYDPRQLRKHLLAERRPAFAAEAAAGDILLVGRRFAHGSQHTHPFLAMKEMGVGLVARTLARPPFRLAIYTGVPVLEIGEAGAATLADGDRLRVDFSSGLIENLSAGTRQQLAPLPGFLLDIVRAGGGLPFLRDSVVNANAVDASPTPTAATTP